MTVLTSFTLGWFDFLNALIPISVLSASSYYSYQLTAVRAEWFRLNAEFAEKILRERIKTLEKQIK